MFVYSELYNPVHLRKLYFIFILSFIELYFELLMIIFCSNSIILTKKAKNVFKLNKKLISDNCV